MANNNGVANSIKWPIDAMSYVGLWDTLAYVLSTVSQGKRRETKPVVAVNPRVKNSSLSETEGNPHKYSG